MSDIEKYHTGFTLIEVMIVLAIIAILAAFAGSAYNDSVTKARRADAKSALETYATRQEKWFFSRNGYTDNVDNIGGSGGVLLSPEGYYSISIDTSACSPAPFSCYTLTATPVSGGVQEGDADCTTLSITETGLRSATGTYTSVCW